ncbi:MAG: hypothetical protein AAFP76_17215 [Bacteroidota bacterium]
MRTLLFFCILSSFVFKSTAQNNRAFYQQMLDTATHSKSKLLALDSLFSKTHRKDFKANADYLEAFLDIALEEGAYERALELMVKGSYTINSTLQQPDRALRLIGKVEHLVDSTHSSYLRGGILLKKGGAYFNGKNFQKAIDNYNRAFQNFSTADSIYMADAIYFRGQAQSELGNYLEAIEDYQLAYSYYDALGDQDYTFYTEGAVISVYGICGFNEKAIEARKTLIQRMNETSPDQLLVEYFNQAINYENLGEYKKQEESLLKALSYVGKRQDHLAFDTIAVNSALCEFYSKRKEMSKAQKHLEAAEIKVDEINKGTTPYLRFQTAKCEFLLGTGNYDEALQLGKEVLSAAQSFGRASLISNAQKIIYRAYEEKGDMRNALHFHKAYIAIKDSLYSVTKTNGLSYYQSLFETERKQLEIVKKNAEIDILNKDNQIAEGKNRILWVLLCFGLLLAVGVVVFVKFKAQQKREILQLQLASHKKELDEYTEELLAKSNSLEVLTEELQQLKDDFGSSDRLDRLQELVSLKILTADHWKNFKHKFNTVYPNLLVKAREVNNEITNSEERLIALEKLNLKTSEIANILGVSSESVIKIRYRLRKKLGISKDTSILQFIELAS